MKTRIKELEGIITSNEKVISLLEDQVSNIHQNFPPKTPISNLGNHKFGKPLFFEHLPQVQFRHSNEGVLFCLFETGEALFYPLNEQTKGNQPTNSRTYEDKEEVVPQYVGIPKQVI